MALVEDLFKGSTVTGLAVGVGALLLAPTVIPAVGRVIRPAAKAVIKGGMVFYRETLAEVGEVAGDLFAENALQNDLFTVDFEALRAEHERPHQAVTDWAKQRWADADKALRRWTDGNADIRSAAFIIAVLGALVQLYRGQIAPPAATLLWDAGDMLRVWQTALDKRSKATPERTAAEG